MIQNATDRNPPLKRSVSGYLLVISSENQGSPHREPSRFNHINCWSMKMLVWVAHRGAGSRKEWINRLLVYHDHATETLHIYLWVCRVFFETNKNLTLRFKAYIRKIYFGYAGIFQQQAPPISARLRWIPCNTAACRFDAPPEVSGRVGPHAAAEATGLQPQRSHESCQGVAVGKSCVGYRLGIYTIKGANVPRKLHNKRICL